MSTTATALSTLDWTRKLVSFDTTSRGSNLALIETVRDHLHGLGLQTHLSYSDGRDKANLFATVPAADGGVQGGIVLSGHTDVVPVDGQRWSSDPFAPEVRDGRLYGRGTCDMKGFIAASLALVPSVLRAPARADPLGAVIRRRSRLHGRAAHDRRPDRARHPPRRLHRR